MEAYFDSTSEDVRDERLLILILSIVEKDILGQSKFSDHEIKFKKFKNLALEILYRQRNLKEIFALELLE